MKVSGFIISLILVAVLIVPFGYFLSQGAVEAGVTYNQTMLDRYNTIADLNETVTDINTKINSFNPSNPVDIIGGFLTGGFTVLKVSFQTFAVFTGIANDATDKIGEAAGFGGFSTMTAGLILIAFIIFIFIIVSVLVGREV